ncbi:MAG: TfoX/Sxy family protein [Planctomycetes bacterium]|nr:TfoX/Sxy family protein [Planctomycetota bacterium]
MAKSDSYCDFVVDQLADLGELDVRHGMGPFRPNKKQTLKSYYQVPVELIEDAETLCQWARKAVACQKAK